MTRGTVDEDGVHAHRQNPVLVRGLSRRFGARCPLLRHGRVHDRAVPPGLSRRADARVRRPGRSGATTFSSSAASMSRGGTTGSGSSKTSGRGCTSATSSERARVASPWRPARGVRRGTPARKQDRSRPPGRRVVATSVPGRRRDESTFVPMEPDPSPRNLARVGRSASLSDPDPAGRAVAPRRSPRAIKDPRQPIRDLPKIRCRPGARPSSARETPRSPRGSARCRRERSA